MAEYEAFKKWVGSLAASNVITRSAYEDLVECWVFYHGDSLLRKAAELEPRPQELSTVP